MCIPHQVSCKDSRYYMVLWGTVRQINASISCCYAQGQTEIPRPLTVSCEHRPRPTTFISISAATSFLKQLYERLPQNDWTIGAKWTWTRKASTKSTSTKSHSWNVALNYGRSKCHPNTRLGRKATNASWPSISCKPTWSISTTLIPTWTEGESVSKALSSIKQLASDLTWLDIDICRQHLAASGSCSQFWAPMGSQLFQMFSLMQVKTLGSQPAEHLMNVRIWAKLRNAKWLYRLKSTPAKSLRIK